MITDTTHTAAKLIVDKLGRKEQPFALFAGYGSWVLVKPNTGLFLTKLRQRPEHFRGLFDYKATVDIVEAEVADAWGVQ